MNTGKKYSQRDQIMNLPFFKLLSSMTNTSQLPEKFLNNIIFYTIRKYYQKDDIPYLKELYSMFY